jgi:hypothetical protein
MNAHISLRFHSENLWFDLGTPLPIQKRLLWFPSAHLCTIEQTMTSKQTTITSFHQLQNSTFNSLFNLRIWYNVIKYNISGMILQTSPWQISLTYFTSLYLYLQSCYKIQHLIRFFLFNIVVHPAYVVFNNILIIIIIIIVMLLWLDQSTQRFFMLIIFNKKFINIKKHCVDWSNNNNIIIIIIIINFLIKNLLT